MNNGRAAGTNGSRNGGGGGGNMNNKKENVSMVYRVDAIEHEDPAAIQNAINTAVSK